MENEILHEEHTQDLKLQEEKSRLKAPADSCRQYQNQKCLGQARVPKRSQPVLIWFNKIMEK